jgi:hypothetical protein
MKLVISVLFSLCTLLLADFARAEQLYGLTRIGQLVAIDTTTGAGQLVLTLPSRYANFRGVEYWPGVGKFYASYDGGSILSFNLDGVVSNHGPSGYPIVNELSLRPDNQMYAVISLNDERLDGSNDGRSESLGMVYWTGDIIVTAFPSNASVLGVGASFKGLVYLDNTNFYAFNAAGGMYEHASGSLLPLTANAPYFTVDGAPVPPGSAVSWGILTGLAKSPSNGTIYGVNGYEPVGGTYTPIPSTLFRINYQTPNLPQQPIGATGFSGIVGLTFGPAAPTPLTPPPVGLAAKLCVMGVICPTPTPTR